MEYKEILFDVDGAVATMTLNRPDIRNAITHPEMIEEIKSVCATVNADKGIHVLIVTATDPAFCSGGNVKDMKERRGMFEGTPPELFDKYRSNIQEVLLAVHKVEVPTIAAVNGFAIGAGLGLALLCDIRVASRRATFGQTVLNVGLVPADGSAWLLPRMAGMGKAAELLLCAETVDAETALTLGLVNYVEDHEAFFPKAREVALKIAMRPTQALRLTKRLLRSAPYTSLEQNMRNAAAFQALCHYTEDHMEALCAMFEKRKPQFKGR